MLARTRATATASDLSLCSLVGRNVQFGRQLGAWYGGCLHCRVSSARVWCWTGYRGVKLKLLRTLRHCMRQTLLGKKTNNSKTTIKTTAVINNIKKH